MAPAGKRAHGPALLDELLWTMVRQRWALLARGVPKKLTLTLDSTVVVRYGHKQAGAELGYNPKKRGRRSHHPHALTVYGEAGSARSGPPGDPRSGKATGQQTWASTRPAASPTEDRLPAGTRSNAAERGGSSLDVSAAGSRGREGLDSRFVSEQGSQRAKPCYSKD